MLSAFFLCTLRGYKRVGQMAVLLKGKEGAKQKTNKNRTTDIFD
jgi:hypothetical protein